MQHRRYAMRSSTLFTVIAIGSATVASAQPKQEETSGRVRLDDDENKSTNAPRQPGDWVELASPTPAKHGTEFVIVGKEAGAFSKLRIDPAKGKTIVRKVKVFFTDGKVKVVHLDKIVSEGKGPALIELGDPRAIDRIVVNTEAYTSGKYAIYGSSEVGSGAIGTR
jgi:hypothetical protein